MSRVISWLLGLAAAAAGLFAFRRHIESLAAAKERRELKRAVRTVEKQLKKEDQRLDDVARARIETIRKATREILSKTPTGKTANDLIKRVASEK